MKMDASPTTLARGSAILMAAFFFGMVLSYAFAISMGWLLSTADYGMFGVAQSLIAIGLLFTGAAFPWVVTKLISEPRHQDNHTIVKSSLVANLALGILLCLFLYLSYRFGLLPLGKEYQSIIIVVIITILVTSIVAVYRGLLQGLLRFKQVGIVGCVQPVFLLLSGVVFVLLGFGALGAIAGYVIAALAALSFYLYYARDQGFWKAGSLISKETYALVIPMFLGIVGAQLLMNIDILGVKFLIPGMSDVMAGYYRASLVWARLPVFFTVALAGAFLPFISYYAGSEERVKSYSSKMIKYAFIFLLPICLATFIIPGPLITLVFPASYIAGAQALRILSIGMFLLALAYIYSSVFQGVGKPKIPALIMTGAIAILIICLYLLVPRHGLSGAAISTTLACIFSFALLQYAYIRRYGIELDVADAGKLISASVILLAILYFLPTSNRFFTVLSLVCGLGVFFVFLAAVKFLDYIDVDILFSGVFGSENRFRAKMVGFVQRLNMATSESKSPRVRTVEQYLPFILALGALVSAMVIPSENAVAAIFAFTLIIYALRRYNSNILIVAALTLLILAAILFAGWGEAVANQVTIPAFYFLAIGVIGAVIDFIWQRKERGKAGDE